MISRFRHLVHAASALFVLVAVAPMHASAQSSTVDEVAKSIVRIHVEGNAHFVGEAAGSTTADYIAVDNWGSGFFLSDEGFIATAHHTLFKYEGRDIVWRTLPDGKRDWRISIEYMGPNSVPVPYSGSVDLVPVPSGPLLDVAVLQIGGSGWDPLPCSFVGLARDAEVRGVGVRVDRTTYDPLGPGRLAPRDPADGLRYRIVGLSAKNGHSGGPLFQEGKASAVGLITASVDGRLARGASESFATPLYPLRTTFPFDQACNRSVATDGQGPDPVAEPGQVFVPPEPFRRATKTTLGTRVVRDRFTFTREDSPYRITGRIQIADQGRVAMQPGVVVEFDEGASLEVFGILEVVGSEEHPIVLRGEGTGEGAGIVLKTLDLDRTRLRWIQFERRANLVIEGRAPEGDSVNPVLKAHHLLFRRSTLSLRNATDSTRASSTGVAVELTDASFRNSEIRLVYAHPPGLTVRGADIADSVVHVESYAQAGLSIVGGSVRNTVFKVGCCSARLGIRAVDLRDLVIEPGDGSPVTGPIEIADSVVNGFRIALPNAAVSILRSRFDQTFARRFENIRAGELTLVDSCFIGEDRGTLLLATGFRGYDADRARHTIEGVMVANALNGIEIAGGNSVYVHNVAFTEIDETYIINRSRQDFSVGLMFPPSADVDQVIFDARDELNSGAVTVSSTQDAFNNLICEPIETGNE